MTGHWGQFIGLASLDEVAESNRRVKATQTRVKMVCPPRYVPG